MRRSLAAAVVAVVAVTALVAACTRPVAGPKSVDERPPADFPERHYAQAIARGAPVYRVDPTRSRAIVEVRRGGALARLGHDHVVAGHDLRGYVAPDEGRADVYLRLDRLVVDEPELRAEAGFDTEPSAADVAATRRNMLDAVLEAERHPYALVSAIRAEGAGGDASLIFTLTLHGIARSFEIPVALEADRDRVEVSGRMTLDQTAFGIAPFTALGGALRVLDRVDVRFRIRADRVDS